MAILVDTSVLGRLANRVDFSYAVATYAVAEFHRRGEVLHLTPQNLIEFRAFATRPILNNGLGLPTLAAESLEANFEAAFPVLDETPALYPAWKTLVKALSVVGKQVHDARLVAVGHVHGLTHLLTFNLTHFARLTSFGPRVVVLEPANL